MLTIAKIAITCAECKETLELHYSHESLAARTLADDIKHDATISSEWHILDGGLFYCESCGEGMKNARDEQAKMAQAEDNAAWRMAGEAEISIPYASAVRGCLNNWEG